MNLPASTTRRKKKKKKKKINSEILLSILRVIQLLLPVPYSVVPWCKIWYSRGTFAVLYNLIGLHIVIEHIPIWGFPVNKLNNKIEIHVIQYELYIFK